MPDILILLSHPEYARSRANRAMAEAAARVPGVEVAHLDGLYPDGRIDADAEVSRLVAARRVVLLADHTKASVDHLVRFGELADVDTFVTDSGLDERTAAEIASYGPRVVRA